MEVLKLKHSEITLYFIILGKMYVIVNDLFHIFCKNKLASKINLPRDSKHSYIRFMILTSCTLTKKVIETSVVKSYEILKPLEV